MPKPSKQVIIDAIVKEIELGNEWLSEYLREGTIYKITPPPGCNSVNVHGSYVYALINPVDGKIFYIGKGTGKRSEHHLKLLKNDCNAKKKEIIKELYLNKKFPIIWKLEHNLSSRKAVDLECILINCIPGLTNIIIPEIKDDNCYFKPAERIYQNVEFTEADCISEVIETNDLIDLMITVVCHGILYDINTFFYGYNGNLYKFVDTIHLLPDHLRKELSGKKYKNKDYLIEQILSKNRSSVKC